MTLTIGSLFSGIGGLELGLERAGLGPVLWQCEIDPFCRRVLAKHWPTVTRFEDVTQPRSYPHADLICGGFPCQDVSVAGRGAGLGGARSGLWFHFAGVIARARPRFVVIENVASGARRWLPAVRRHLCELGYDSTAFGISAADVGAPHLRRRVFVVAHTERELVRVQQGRRSRAHWQGSAEPRLDGSARPSATHSDCAQREGDWRSGGAAAELADARDDGDARSARAPAWPTPPVLRGVDDGIPRGLDRARRLKALGNAVVPQCAEVVGRMILARWVPSAKVSA